MIAILGEDTRACVFGAAEMFRERFGSGVVPYMAKYPGLDRVAELPDGTELLWITPKHASLLADSVISEFRLGFGTLPEDVEDLIDLAQSRISGSLAKNRKTPCHS